MVKNNFLILLFHLVLGFFFFCIFTLIQTNPAISAIIYGYFPLRILLVLLIFFVYYFFGRFLKEDIGVGEILGSFLLPLFLGFLFFFIAFFEKGESLLETVAGSSIYRIPFDLYTFPGLWGSYLLGIQHRWEGYIMALFMGFVPMFLSLSIHKGRRTYRNYKRKKTKRF